MTLATVARAVGVSAQTVSNAYNRPSKLSPALRERVLATARELGYGGPDAAARSLRRGRAGAIGVLFGEALPYAFDDPGAVQFFSGLAAGCVEEGVGLQLVPATGQADDEGRVRNAVVDGFVLWALAEDDPLVELVLARELPVVAIGSPFLPDHPFIAVDNRAGARAAAQHVLALGHRRAAIIAFPLGRHRRDSPFTAADERHASQRVTRERLAGYTEAFAAARVPWTGYEVAVNTREHGHTAATALLSGEPRPSALLAMSDELALGALTAAQALGLNVPHDVSITGWDDTREAQAATPSLTTVHQDLRDQGRLAARALLAPEATQPATQAPRWTLITRSSTTAPSGPGTAAPGDAR